jgi:hypothetical protein
MWGRGPVLALVTAGVLLAGCAKGDDDTSASDSASAVESPPATVTPEPGKAEGTYAGDFHLVDNPPEDTKDVTGTAKMVVGDDGTEVTVDAAGLVDKASYIAFVYDDACAAAEPGGAHYVIDPDADDDSAMIHLEIEVKDGKGTAEAKSDKQATTAARSVIIHLLRAADAKKDEKNPPKVACADLVKS